MGISPIAPTPGLQGSASQLVARTRRVECAEQHYIGQAMKTEKKHADKKEVRTEGATKATRA